jgi:hypothetical protein
MAMTMAEGKRRSITKSIQIDAALVDGLAELADRLTNETREATDSSDDGSVSGKRRPRVTIRSIVEEAVLGKWPDLRLGAGVTSAPDTEESKRAVFDAILAAVYRPAGIEAQNAAIDKLDGGVVGSFGQRLGLRELAYHLRANGERPIGTLDELVKDFEGMG